MLRDEIDQAQRLVKTDTVHMTIGEISRMYEDAELNISPDFQRLFRWSIEKKSSFVESIYVGIPIPPAFAYENEDGTWELIDGLQRISTILEFMGVLKGADEEELPSSTLTGTKYLPSLQGVSWDESSEQSFSRAQKLLFRRARLDFQILKSPSDPRTKFDLFQRLNRGGAYANPQEVRSCAMVLANQDFTRAIKEFASSDNFKEVFRVNDNQERSQTNVDYAVRLIVHSCREFTGDTDVEEFLDKAIIDVLISEDQRSVMRNVGWAIEVLHRLFGRDALVPTEDARENAANRFSLRALEGIAVGLVSNRTAIRKLEDPDSFIRAKVEAFWRNNAVVAMSASGLRGTTRIQRTVPFGKTWFRPNA